MTAPTTADLTVYLSVDTLVARRDSPMVALMVDQSVIRWAALTAELKAASLVDLKELLDWM